MGDAIRGTTRLIDTARQLAWDNILLRRFTELGNTATIFAPGAILRAGAVTATSFTSSRNSASGLEATVTTRVNTTATALSAWGVPLDLAKPTNWQGGVPIVSFNGSSNVWDTPDAAYWTRALAVASWEVWINIDTLAADRTIFSKWNLTTGSALREWEMFTTATTGLPTLRIYDQTASAWIGRTAAAITINQWIHFVAVYDGTAASSGIKLYVNGAQTDDTNDESGVFVSMQDTAEVVRVGAILGTGGTIVSRYSGKIAVGPLGPAFTQIALTAAQVKNLYYAGAEALGL